MPAIWLTTTTPRLDLRRKHGFLERPLFPSQPRGRVNRQADETSVKFQDEWVEAVDLELAKSPAVDCRWPWNSTRPPASWPCMFTPWFEDLDDQARLALLVSSTSLGLSCTTATTLNVTDYEFDICCAELDGAKGLVVADNAAAGMLSNFTMRPHESLVGRGAHRHCGNLTADNGSVIQVLSPWPR